MLQREVKKLISIYLDHLLFFIYAVFNIITKSINIIVKSIYHYKYYLFKIQQFLYQFIFVNYLYYLYTVHFLISFLYGPLLLSSLSFQLRNRPLKHLKQLLKQHIHKFIIPILINRDDRNTIGFLNNQFKKSCPDIL